jgi:hypothetical protein
VSTPTPNREKVALRVRRTSQWGDEVAPCPEAYKGTYTEHAYCTLPLAQAMKAPQTDWFRRLTNQRKAPGGSVGDRPDQPCWFVDIDNLDALLAFIERHGEIVMASRSDGPTIEIYDGYRE